MKNKVRITLLVIVGAVYALANANVVLNFPDLNIQSFQNKFSLVHFMAPGNDFGGSIFRLATKSVPQTTISLNGDTRTCTKLVRGLYFNSQRGKRLRPLDNYTLTLLQQQDPSYNDLQVQGGLYTTCDTGYSIFGSIKYTRGGVISYVVAGTQLDYQHNKMIPNFAQSFQYFDNKTPIGYIYDSNGGIGFVGGDDLNGNDNLINFLDNGGSINSGFTYSGDTIISNTPDRSTTTQGGNSAMETMRNLIIQGSVELPTSINQKDRTSLLGNLNNKTVIYNGSDINSSTMINFAKQKAQELCQGKEMDVPLANSDTIACYDTDLTIDLSQGTDYENKTIIVNNANVILQGGMNDSSPALDLFIDKGLLYLPDPITPQTFDNQGFPSTPGITEGLFLKGNFIINGLIVGNALSPFDHKLHIEGKVTTLNTPLEPTSGRIGQIESMFGGPSYDSFINLQNVFIRECGLNGSGSDGTTCGTGSVISTTPLVILNGNYPSNLLQ